MVSGHPRFSKGPVTYTVYQTVLHGQLVVIGTSGNVGLVGVAGAGAVNCLGVAENDALPASTSPTGTSIGGQPLLDTSVQDAYVAVGNDGIYRLTAAAALLAGDPLKCAAAGQVTKFVDGTDNPGLKIGRCIEAAGIASGAVGACLIRIA